MVTVAHVLVTTCCTIVLLAGSPAFCAESPAVPNRPTRIQPAGTLPECAGEGATIKMRETVASLYAAVIKPDNATHCSALVTNAKAVLPPEAVAEGFLPAYTAAPSAEARRALVFFLCMYACERTDIPAATRHDALVAIVNAIDGTTATEMNSKATIIYYCSDIDAQRALPVAQAFAQKILESQQIGSSKQFAATCKSIQFALLNARTREGNMSAAAFARQLADAVSLQEIGYPTAGSDVMGQVLFPMAIIMGELQSIEATRGGVITRDGCLTFLARFETLAATDRLAETARENLRAIPLDTFRHKDGRTQATLAASWQIAANPDKHITDSYTTFYDCCVNTVQRPPWLELHSTNDANDKTPLDWTREAE